MISKTKAFKYIVRGFFPVLYDDLNMKTQLFYSSYLTIYLEKDLKELVYDNYSKQVGVSTNTIKAWISVLVKTGIVYLVETYNEESIIKRVVKKPKMYFFDTGFAAYLCGIDSAQTLQKSFLKGRFFETFIFNEIRKSYMNDGQMQQLYYYRDSEQNNVDLILLKNGVLSCVEIKALHMFNASNTKGFRMLQNTRYEKGKNAIICKADKISIISDGALILPISSI